MAKSADIIPLRSEGTQVAAPKPPVRPRKPARPGGAGPSGVQRAWLQRGLSEPGGKLPLFDADGRRIDPRTIRACIEQGWAEPWFTNPLKPDWLVCRLTEAGRALLIRD
jgi:hypothetical protein